MQIPLPSPNTTPFFTPMWSNMGDRVLHYRVSEDEHTLMNVSFIMANFNSELVRFQPRMVLVATLFIELKTNVRKFLAVYYRATNPIIDH